MADARPYHWLEMRGRTEEERRQAGPPIPSTTQGRVQVKPPAPVPEET